MKQNRTTKAIALALSGLLALSGAGFAAMAHIAAAPAYAFDSIVSSDPEAFCRSCGIVAVPNGDPAYCPLCSAPAAPSSSIVLNAAGAPVANPVEYNIYKLFSANVNDEGMASDIRYSAPFSAEIIAGVVPSKPVDSEQAAAAAAARAAIVERAMAEVGKPYGGGACGPVAYDALGLVCHCLTGQHARIIPSIERLLHEPYVPSEPLPGDICVKMDGQHCGVYIGDGQMIHAPGSGRPVQIAPVQADMVYRIPYTFAPALRPPTSTAPAAPSASDFEIPLNAAEYIAENIQDGSTLAADDFGMKLARAIIAADAEPMTTILSDGVPVEVDGPGYYLIVRKDALDGTLDEDALNRPNIVASSPIFLLVGEGTTTATEKSAIPSVKKYVRDDAAEEWGKEADDTIHNYVDFKIIGTLPSDLSSYESYFYAFRDTVDSKLGARPQDLTVKIDGVALEDENGTPLYSVEVDLETGTFSVIIADILALDGFDVSPSSEIVVEYSIQLQQHAPEGAVNEVYVEYSNNPVNMDSHGTTKTDQAVVYSYALTIDKKDDTGAPLPGVGFTVKNTEGVYIVPVGILGDEGANTVGEVPGDIASQDDFCRWYTDSDGRIVIEGIDLDEYIIEEVAPLEGYIPLDGTFTVRITTEDREVVEYEITEKPEAGVSMAEDAVEVINLKQISLPLTGMAGYAGLILIGIGLVGFALYRFRRKDAEEE